MKSFIIKNSTVDEDNLWAYKMIDASAMNSPSGMLKVRVNVD